MQISKLKLGVCAAALCWSAANVQASDDTPAQAVARAALLQRMQQADGVANQPASMAPAPAADQTPAPGAPAAPSAPAMSAAPARAMSSTPASPEVNSGDSVAQAIARAALLKRMQETDANGAVPPENNAMTPAEVKAIADAAAQANADKATAEQAEARKKADMQAADQANAAAKGKTAQDAQAAAMAASYPGKEMGFQPPQIAPSPISPEKQAKLDALLIQYKADQISPEEYHQQRAAILAGP